MEENEMDLRMERAIRYVEGDMTAFERAEFEAELRADPLLRSDMEAARKTLGGLRHLGEERLRSELKEADRILIGEGGATTGARGWWWSAAAALLLVGLGTWWFSNRDTPDRLASEFAIRDPGLPVLMGQTPRAMDAIMNAYKQDQFLAARSMITEALVTQPGNDTLTYFLGVVEMQLDNSNTAVQAFAGLNAKSVFRIRGDYHRAICALRDGKLSEARTLLQQVAASNEPQLSAKARDLLERLKDL